ncbi:MAG TPA: GntP family permease, partial [Aliidiomarina sp.]|nr:GntP family permease [Aliidiomarina sp.]
MLSMLGLVGGLVLLIILTLRGWNLFISAPLCALFVAITAQVPVFVGDINFVDSYMNG